MRGDGLAQAKSVVVAELLGRSGKQCPDKAEHRDDNHPQRGIIDAKDLSCAFTTQPVVNQRKRLATLHHLSNQSRTSKCFPKATCNIVLTMKLFFFVAFHGDTTERFMTCQRRELHVTR